MSDYFDRIERQLVKRAQAPARRSSWLSAGRGYIVPTVAVLITIAVVLVFVAIPSHRSSRTSVAGSGSELVFTAQTLDPHASLEKAIDASIVTLRARLASVDPGLDVSRAGDTVVIRGASAGMRSTILELAATASGSPTLFDWEANVLTSSGKTVAGQLGTHNARAVLISQGGASAAPGEPGAGGLGLYQAVKLASKQPVAPTRPSLSRLGPEHYAFGAPRSAACARAATFYETVLMPREHCLLSGPDISVAGLDSDLPPGVPASSAQQLAVPQGTLVLQATNPSAADQIQLTSPTARFYVLKDNVTTFANDITDPHQSTDEGGSPDVQFNFTSGGNTKFERITRQIAHRGEMDSDGQLQLDQHFAIALDDQLLTVPSIDYRVYPDGITDPGGADITGALTTQTARNLSVLLRHGSLQVRLIAR